MSSDAKYWKATEDPSTGKTYYYHSKTKEVSWVKPEGFRDRSKKTKKTKKSAEDDEGKVEEGVKLEDTAPASRLEEVSATKTEQNDNDEDKKEIDPRSDDEWGEDEDDDVFNNYDSQNNATEVKNPIEEDAPFDEPVPFDEPGPIPSPRAQKQSTAPTSPLGQSKDDMAVPSETKRMASITNRVHSDNAYEFTTRQRTFMSHMTDTTKKIDNTKQKDFTDTQINVDVNTSLDSSIASDIHSPGAESSFARDNDVSASDSKALVEKSAPNAVKKNALGLQGPGSASANQAIDYTQFPEEEEPVMDDSYDDWSDEVSELSGIGNESSPDMVGGRNKLLIGRSGMNEKGAQRDSRTEKSSPREPRSNDVTNWTQEELDSFISKNDWGSVSKYIAEIRDNKQKKISARSQPSIEQIQAQVEYNRSLESDGEPRKKFGAKSQVQHRKIEEEDSSGESLWNSLSSASHGSSNEESSFVDRPRRRRHSRQKPRRMV